MCRGKASNVVAHSLKCRTRYLWPLVRRLASEDDQGLGSLSAKAVGLGLLLTRRLVLLFERFPCHRTGLAISQKCRERRLIINEAVGGHHRLRKDHQRYGATQIWILVSKLVKLLLKLAAQDTSSMWTMRNRSGSSLGCA